MAPTGERRTQWWVFAELSRRLDLPLFGSSRRAAALADRVLDDEVIAEAMAIGARHPWSEVRAAPYGMADDALPAGWLVPGRFPHLLTWPHRSSPASSTDRGRRRRAPPVSWS